MRAFFEEEEGMIVEELQGINKEDYMDDDAAAAQNSKDGDEGAEPEDLSPEEEMMKILGFGGFGSTKGKQVESNTTGAAVGASLKVYAVFSSAILSTIIDISYSYLQHKGRKYRQYMNRKGGFNRPLNKMA